MHIDTASGVHAVLKKVAGDGGWVCETPLLAVNLKGKQKWWFGGIIHLTELIMLYHL